MNLSKLRKTIKQSSYEDTTLPVIKLVKRRNGENNGIEEYDIEEGDVKPLRWSRPNIYGENANPIND